MSPWVVARWETRQQAVALGVLLSAAGWELSLVPALPPDPGPDERLGAWLCRHPLDRIAARLLTEDRPVLGLPTAAGARRVITTLESGDALLVGRTARLAWLPAEDGPPLDTLELVARRIDPPKPVQGCVLHANLAAAGLPAHVLAASVPMSTPLRSPRVLAPEDVLLTQGWTPALARATQVWAALQQRDAGGRQQPPHRPLSRRPAELPIPWPVPKPVGNLGYGILPAAPWHWRHRDVRLNPPVPEIAADELDVEEWDLAEMPDTAELP